MVKPKRNKVADINWARDTKLIGSHERGCALQPVLRDGVIVGHELTEYGKELHATLDDLIIAHRVKIRLGLEK